MSLTRNDLGIIDSTYLTVYMLGQFFFGPLGDRFGPRRILLFGMGLSVLAAVGFGCLDDSCGVPGVCRAAGHRAIDRLEQHVQGDELVVFAPRARPRIGWWCTHYTVGAAVALPFAGWMMDHFGHGFTLRRHRWRSLGIRGDRGPTMLFGTCPFWPAAFWGPAVRGRRVMMLTWLLLRNRPEDVGLPPIEEYHGEPEVALEPTTRRSSNRRTARGN